MIIDLCKSASLCEDCRPYNVSKTTQCHILAANVDPNLGQIDHAAFLCILPGQLMLLLTSCFYFWNIKAI